MMLKEASVVYTCESEADRKKWIKTEETEKKKKRKERKATSSFNHRKKTHSREKIASTKTYKRNFLEGKVLEDI